MVQVHGNAHSEYVYNEKTHERARTHDRRPRVLLVIQRRYRVTSCKAMYIQPGILSFELSKGRVAVVNIHRTLFSARVPAVALPADRSYRSLSALLSSGSQREKKKVACFLTATSRAARPCGRIYSRVKERSASPRVTLKMTNRE